MGHFMSSSILFVDTCCFYFASPLFDPIKFRSVLFFFTCFSRVNPSIDPPPQILLASSLSPYSNLFLFSYKRILKPLHFQFYLRVHLHLLQALGPSSITFPLPLSSSIFRCPINPTPSYRSFLNPLCEQLEEG